MSKNLYAANNVFGQYALIFNLDQLAPGPVVPLGEINGTPTYLSVPEPLALHIAHRLGRQPTAGLTWFDQPKVNVIVGWHVPLDAAVDLEICSSWSDRHGGRHPIGEGTTERAGGTLLALLLLSAKSDIDRLVISKIGDFAADLIRTLVGRDTACQRRRQQTAAAAGDLPSKTLGLALEGLVGGLLEESRLQTAEIGDQEEVVLRLAEMINSRFNRDVSTALKTALD
jgi:hypothetical protein